MLFNPLLWSREQVEAAVDAAKEAVMANQKVVSFSSLGTSAQFQQTYSPEKVLDEALLYFQMQFPDEFPTNNPYRGKKSGRIIH